MKHEVKLLFFPGLVVLTVFSAMSMQQENPSNSNNASISEEITSYEEEEEEYIERRTDSVCFTSVAEALAANTVRRPIDPKKIVTRSDSKNNPTDFFNHRRQDSTTNLNEIKIDSSEISSNDNAPNTNKNESCPRLRDMTRRGLPRNYYMPDRRSLVDRLSGKK